MKAVVSRTHCQQDPGDGDQDAVEVHRELGLEPLEQVSEEVVAGRVRRREDWQEEEVGDEQRRDSRRQRSRQHGHPPVVECGRRHA